MKKSLLLMILSVAMLVMGLSAYAQDSSAQLAALEQQAERIQNQINQAQQQCGAKLNNQLKPLSDSIESLVKQRVQFGAQIQQMESQVQDLKQSALSTCSRQVKQRDRGSCGREAADSEPDGQDQGRDDSEGKRGGQARCGSRSNTCHCR